MLRLFSKVPRPEDVFISSVDRFSPDVDAQDNGVYARILSVKSVVPDLRVIALTFKKETQEDLEESVFWKKYDHVFSIYDLIQKSLVLNALSPGSAVLWANIVAPIDYKFTKKRLSLQDQQKRSNQGNFTPNRATNLMEIYEIGKAVEIRLSPLRFPSAIPFAEAANQFYDNDVFLLGCVHKGTPYLLPKVLPRGSLPLVLTETRRNLEHEHSVEPSK